MRRSQGTRLSVAVWVLAAFVILTATQLDEPHSGVAVVRLPHSAAILSTDVWDVPAAEFPIVRDNLWWPGWIVNGVVALVIGVLAARLTRGGLPWLAAANVLILSLYAEPGQMLIAVALLLVVHVVASQRLTEAPGRWLGGAGLGLAIAMVFSVDFGFLVLLIAAVIPVEIMRAVKEQRHATAGMAALLCGLLLGCMVVEPSLARAAMRPVLSLGLPAAASVCSELGVPLLQPRAWLAVGWILGVSVTRLRAARRGQRTTAELLAVMLPFGFAGILSAYCLWPALVVISALPWPSGSGENSLAAERPAGKARLAICLLAAIVLMWHAGTLGSQYWLGNVASRLVDCSGWEASGRVLLTNLDHADEWKGALAPKRVELIVDDRWDAAEFPAERYAAVCHEFLHGRRDLYTRRDGRLGGYHQAFADWQPGIVVVDTDRWRPVRQLSVDPSWRLLAIDGRRVVYGRADEPGVARQADRAAALLSFLEWPNPGQSVELEGILELGTSFDARRIAAALNAMRLPYAALRVLPDDQHLSTKFLRAWSYLELSVRSIRQTGRRSLIDQVRAVLLFREVDAAPLSSLRRQSLPAIDRSVLQTEPVAVEPTDDAAVSAAAETAWRDSLASGDVVSCRQQLVGIEDPHVRAYYGALLSLCDHNRTASISLLEDAVAHRELTARLRAEGYYYLGCLFLEEGQADDAIRCLQQSRTLGPDSPFAPLRDLYLNRLGASPL